MKTKSKSKKADPKKAPKRNWKLVASKPVREVKIQFSVRQLTPAVTAPGTKHLVRVVNDCSTSTLVFSTIDEVNQFLFDFDREHFGQDSSHTGTWIDQIVTHVEGELFDLDQLEAEND